MMQKNGEEERVQVRAHLLAVSERVRGSLDTVWQTLEKLVVNSLASDLAGARPSWYGYPAGGTDCAHSGLWLPLASLVL